jgi:tRNA A37 threonylcarbamoyladenosine synthetase subunit TsaC/SUA5/YrdC
LIDLLIDELPFPLVCATASLGADYKAKNFHTAKELFGEQVPLIVDGGKCKYENKNTKIDCSLSIPTILNFGVVSYDDLRLFLPTIELPSHLRK